jgi:3-oxoacyl-[acyl-carrier protein] reductase
MASVPYRSLEEDIMAFDFSGRRVVVCGASRGIGRSIALGFASAGAGVSICARGAEALEATRAEVAAFGHTAHAATCDLADAAAISAYITQAAKALGGIDILVNNASGFGMTDDEAGWNAGFQVDVMAIVRASHAALPYLEQTRGGCIISISSISALHPSTRSAPYGALKAAVDHYTSSQAVMLAPKGIRVNAIAPGSIEFPGGSWEKRKLEGSPLYANVLSRIAAGRLGKPEEIADTALFLASPYANWITGQSIVVDGGQSLSN